MRKTWKTANIYPTPVHSILLYSCICMSISSHLYIGVKRWTERFYFHPHLCVPTVHADEMLTFETDSTVLISSNVQYQWIQLSMSGDNCIHLLFHVSRTHNYLWGDYEIQHRCKISIINFRITLKNERASIFISNAVSFKNGTHTWMEQSKNYFWKIDG